MLAASRGYITFAFFSTLSLLLLSSFLFVSARHLSPYAYDNDRLYYSASMFKRLASDKAESFSSTAVAAARDAEPYGDYSAIAINATIAAWLVCEADWNLNSASTSVSIDCGAGPDLSSCADSLAYLPPNDASPNGRVQIIGTDGKISIILKSKSTGREIHAHLPSGMFMGAR